LSILWLYVKEAADSYQYEACYGLQTACGEKWQVIMQVDCKVHHHIFDSIIFYLVIGKIRLADLPIFALGAASCITPTLTSTGLCVLGTLSAFRID
jgi:hypothetical protein